MIKSFVRMVLFMPLVQYLLDFTPLLAGRWSLAVLSSTQATLNSRSSWREIRKDVSEILGDGMGGGQSLPMYGGREQTPNRSGSKIANTDVCDVPRRPWGGLLTQGLASRYVCGAQSF